MGHFTLRIKNQKKDERKLSSLKATYRQIDNKSYPICLLGIVTMLYYSMETTQQVSPALWKLNNSLQVRLSIAILLSHDLMTDYQEDFKMIFYYLLNRAYSTLYNTVILEITYDYFNHPKRCPRNGRYPYHYFRLWLGRKDTL